MANEPITARVEKSAYLFAISTLLAPRSATGFLRRVKAFHAHKNRPCRCDCLRDGQQRISWKARLLSKSVAGQVASFLPRSGKPRAVPDRPCDPWRATIAPHVMLK